MQSHRSRQHASSQPPAARQCGVLLVGFGQETEQHHPVSARLDGNLVRVVDHSTSLVEALDKLKTEPIELVLLDSQFTEEELMLFVCDARRRGFEGMAFLAAEDVHQMSRFPSPHGSREAQRPVQTVGGPRPDQAETGNPISFTEKQRAVLDRVSRGWTNLQIASDLNCSEGAVKATVQQLFRKLGVRKRAQIVRMAFENGFRGSLPGHWLSNPR